MIHLEIGRPHSDSPAEAKAGAADALADGRVHYTASRGILPLREAISTRLAARSGVRYDAESEIVVTAGGSEATLAAAFACAPAGGGEALVFTPAWPHYDAQLRLAGLDPVHVPCRHEDRFLPDPEAVARTIGPRTCLMVVSSPSNPSGAVWPPERLAALAELAQAHGLRVISDEIYDRFVYGPAEHTSIAALPGMRERTVIAQSFSKSHSMSGWRVGFAAAPQEVSARITALHQYIAVCAPTFAQHGVLAALRAGEKFTDALVSEYGQRRDELVAALDELPGLELTPPEGALYAFPRLADGADAGPLAREILDRTGVAVVPGAGFGAPFEAHLRICFAVGDETLREGLRRLTSFFGGQ